MSLFPVTLLSLVALAAWFAPVPVPGQDLAPPQNPPRRLTVADDARPIWSPTRPSKPVAEISDQTGEPASTLRFVQAGWGRDKSALKPTDSTVVLRWRSHKPDAAFQNARSNSQIAIGKWQNSDAASETAVRPVSHEQTLSPFDDPFGDKLVQSAEPQGKLPPYESPKPKLDEAPGAASEPVPPPVEVPLEQAAPATQPPERPSEQMQSPAEPAEPKPPAPPLELPGELESPPPPAAEGTETAEGKPCKKIYNERDCCEEAQKCNAARMALRQNSIKNISLDITASFKPDAESIEQEQEARSTQLRLMPPRKWRNRAGELIAEGRLTDLRNRRAIVTEDNGHVTAIQFGKLSDDDLCFLAAWWGVPTECTLGDDPFAPRQWEPVTFAWKASALSHKPLYFEEVQLERYGHTTGPIFQPVLSTAHFFLNVALLPYKMGINPPNECQYALGYYRPGSCAPWLLPPAPLSIRGGLVEGGAITGLLLLFP